MSFSTEQFVFVDGSLHVVRAAINSFISAIKKDKSIS